MDAKFRHSTVLVVAALLSTAIGSNITQSAESSIGYVKSVAGLSSVLRSGDRNIAASGQPLFEKDILETGGDGALGVTLKDNTLLSLGPNSSLTLETYLLRPDQDSYSLITRITRGTVQYVS